MTLRLRAVLPEDFAELYALDQACFAPGIAWSKAELGYFLKYPSNFGIVALDHDSGIADSGIEDSGIAGFAIAGTQRRRGALIGRLITIDVRAEMRRHGVGRQLIEAAEDRLRAAGAASIVLEVAVDNAAAQSFYERHGFARTGRIPGYYLGRLDAFAMEKPL
ncbi:MAG TPA: N-acetyltransferase [Acidobacteriaceae bacterium]|nr:N-acetyltransferase [Acidobacteriaceae bacterium]